MRKIIAILLSMLLALTLFAACGGGGGKSEGGGDEESQTIDVAADPTDTTEAPSSEDETTEEPTTEEPTTEAPEEADPLLPPANLNTLSKAEQLEYFNLAANRVRKEKPGFKNETLRTLGKLDFTGAVSAVSGIVDMVKKRLMPGNWEYETISKGNGNDGKFFSENANASDLRVGDVTSISSTKSGENWVIKVNVIQENNPGKGTSSANSRINCIATRQEVLDEITGISSAISADVEKATLTYHSGYAQITVNPKGQVISSECGFQVKAVANDVKISFLKTNVTAPQTSLVKCNSFVW